MQATGHLVAATAELAAGVQRRHDERDRRDLLDGVLVDRDAAAVVDDAHSAVGLQRHLDVGRMAGQRLVDGVVDGLVDQMVQAALTGGPDVHARPLAHRFEPFEQLDVARVVGRRIFTFSVSVCCRWRPAARKSQNQYTGPLCASHGHIHSVRAGSAGADVPLRAAKWASGGGRGSGSGENHCPSGLERPQSAVGVARPPTVAHGAPATLPTRRLRAPNLDPQHRVLAQFGIQSADQAGRQQLAVPWPTTSSRRARSTRRRRTLRRSNGPPRRRRPPPASR